MLPFSHGLFSSSWGPFFYLSFFFFSHSLLGLPRWGLSVLAQGGVCHLCPAPKYSILYPLAEPRGGEGLSDVI